MTITVADVRVECLGLWAVFPPPLRATTISLCRSAASCVLICTATSYCTVLFFTVPVLDDNTSNVLWMSMQAMAAADAFFTLRNATRM